MLISSINEVKGKNTIAFKLSVQVDVAILEVGLGGRFHATNVVEKPIVCGISSLGYDHMEILGSNSKGSRGTTTTISEASADAVPAAFNVEARSAATTTTGTPTTTATTTTTAAIATTSATIATTTTPTAT